MLKLILFLLLCTNYANAGLPPTTSKASGDTSFATTFNFAFPNFDRTRSGTTTTFGKLNVSGGGTGATSLTANSVLLGNGTEAIQTVSGSVSGDVLVYNGSTWVNQSMLISQAKMVGTATQAGASSCNFNQSSSTGENDYRDLGTAGACASAWTVTGDVTAVGATSHQITIPNMGPGTYEFILSAPFLTDTAGKCNYRFSDSTNAFGYTMAAQSANSTVGTMVGQITYTGGSATRTFKVQSSDDHAGACYLFNGAAGRNIVWIVKKFPSSAEQAVSASSLPGSWAGYHDNDCSWTTTSGTLVDPSADASCTFTERNNNNFGSVSSAGSKIPGIVFTPKRAGRVQICATINSHTTAGTAGFTLMDGTTEVFEMINTSTVGATTSGCGVYNATDTSPKTLKLQMRVSGGNTLTLGVAGYAKTVDWVLVDLDYGFTVPILIGSVTSNSSGQERIERATITNSGSPVVSSQSGSWISSLSLLSTGRLTVNFAAGAFSGTPTCSCTGTTAVYCTVDGASTISSSTMTFFTHNDLGATANSNIQIICMGPR